jgi:predicted patatin/cPLA2 family phospholipase
MRIGPDHLIDGAIAGRTQILTAAEPGATRIIVLKTGQACALFTSCRAASQVLACMR